MLKNLKVLRHQCGIFGRKRNEVLSIERDLITMACTLVQRVVGTWLNAYLPTAIVDPLYFC